MTAVADSPATLVFARERSADLWAEVACVLSRNHKETGLLGVPLDPDVERYNALDDAGVLRCYTARDDRGLLVGYSVMIVSYSLHSRGSKQALQALQDTTYIVSEFRSGMAGVRLMRWVDEQLIAEGVRVIVRQSCDRHDTSRVLERMGYEQTHRCYARRIDKGV